MRGVMARDAPEGTETRMRGTRQTLLLQVVGWLLVVIGMLLPTVFIVVAPRFLILMLPLACILLVLGLILVSGRWPSGRDLA